MLRHSLTLAPRCPVWRFLPAARVVCLCKIEAVTYRATGSAVFLKGTANRPTGSANSFDVLLLPVLAESIVSAVCEISISLAVTAGSAFCDGSGIRFLPSPVSLFLQQSSITPQCVNHRDLVRHSDEISPYTYRWQIEKSDTAQKIEHPFGCSLILLWVKTYKVYSFAGHLKSVCNDIFDLYSTHKYFEQTSKQNIAIYTDQGYMHFPPGKQRANTSKQPANRDFHAAAGFAHTCLLVRRIFRYSLQNRCLSIYLFILFLITIC